jgi:hypothetical protein
MSQSIVERCFKELAAAQTALTAADTAQAREAVARAAVEKPAAIFNTTGQWQRDAEDARLIHVRRTAQTAFEEASGRHRLATEHKAALDKVSSAVAAALQADAAHTSEMWALSVDEHLKRLPALSEEFSAMAAAADAIPMPVRLALHLTGGPELAWRGCGLTRADVLRRMALIHDRQTMAASWTRAKLPVPNVHLEKPKAEAPLKVAKGKEARG